jgi:ribonuclease R
MTGRKTAYFVCAKVRGGFIPTNNLNHALDKDIVKVYV